MGWVSWHRYLGVGGTCSSAIISGRGIQELKGRKRGRGNGNRKETLPHYDCSALKVKKRWREGEKKDSNKAMSFNVWRREEKGV